MAIMEVRTCPDTVLRKRAEEIDIVDGNMRLLIDDMFETMYHAQGIGLAAPQVGRSIRLIVADIGDRDGVRGRIVLINPVIISKEDEVVDDEGCLSIPDIRGDVSRAARVTVSGKNEHWTDIVINAEGLLSRAFQHEIDHLDGILFWDYMSKAKRDSLKRKYKKSQKEYED